MDKEQKALRKRHSFINIVINIGRLFYVLLLFFRFKLFTKKTVGHHSFGSRIASAAKATGPLFVKFCQSLAVRADLVGEKIAHDLAKLQDQMPHIPEPLVIKILGHELNAKSGKKFLDLFEKFELKPIAAASVAQVHRAKINGLDVAVKVVRPKIKKKIDRDLLLILFLICIWEFFYRPARKLKLREAIYQVHQSLQTETDMRFEAASASKLKDNLQGDEHTYVPKIYWDYVTTDVLVMEWVDGAKIQELDNEKYSEKQVVRNLVHSFFSQVYRDGYFHSDWHSGNVFVSASNQIILIDFGIMCSLDRKTRMFLVEMFRGLVNRDYKKVAKLHVIMGYVDKNVSLDLFENGCRIVGESMVGKDLESIMISEVLKRMLDISIMFNVTVKPELLLFQKSLTVVEGQVKRIDSKANIWEMVKPLVSSWTDDIEWLKQQSLDLLTAIRSI